jgi:peroxiredoxin
VSQLRHRYEEFRAEGAELAAVSFAEGRILEHYANDLHMPFPLLSDPERGVYRSYGLGKGSTWGIFGPKIIWTYIKLMARGRLFRGIQANPYQLGGDFVIDGEGIVRLAHRGEEPTDRPTVEQLLEAVRSPSR